MLKWAWKLIAALIPTTVPHGLGVLCDKLGHEWDDRPQGYIVCVRCGRHSSREAERQHYQRRRSRLPAR